MIIFKTLQLVLVTAFGAALWLFACVGIHELGHVFAAKTLTKDIYQVEQVQIWPALQVYPELKYSPEIAATLGNTEVQMVGKGEPMAQMNTFKAERELPVGEVDTVIPRFEPLRPGQRAAAYPQKTAAAIAPVDPAKLDHTRAQSDANVIALMGSVMTGFVSLLSIVCLICFDLSGVKMFIASVLGLLHLDALFYSFLPSLGLPHLAFVGDKNPEPIAALSYFGIMPMWSFTVFALLSFLQLGLLIHHWQKPAEN